MIVATVFALATLVYVVIDLILELLLGRRKKEEPEEKKVVEQAPIVVHVQAPPVVAPVVLPDIVDHIDAEEADAMISNDVAMSVARTEHGAGKGRKTYINLGVIDKHFDSGDLITLQILKDRRLVDRKAKRIKILADGELTKPLTVKAESYSMQAIKMIELTGGTVIILVD